MSIELAKRYVHYDIAGADKWQTIMPSNIGVTANNLWKYEAYLASGYTIAPGELDDVTPEEEQFALNAAAFVEQETGLKVTCALSKYTELRNNRKGAYDAYVHEVVVRKASTGSKFGDEIAFGGLLVHELTHSTMVGTAKLLDLQDGDNHSVHVRTPQHVGDVTPMFNEDHFFEEGFAEEIASRWRTLYDPNLQQRQRDLLLSHDRSAIPVRMYEPARTIDDTKRDTERGMQYAAYCSFGIQLMSEYTGVDIIELLKQARKAETQQQASAKIKETVDSIEPGLYEVLISAQYTVEDFEDCLKIIKQAIANHAHEQNALAA